MTEHEERNRASRQQKRQRRLELGLEEPTRQEVFVVMVERMKSRGMTSQEIYETLMSFWRTPNSLPWPVMEEIIGGDLVPPDFKIYFKK